MRVFWACAAAAGLHLAVWLIAIPEPQTFTRLGVKIITAPAPTPTPTPTPVAAKPTPAKAKPPAATGKRRTPSMSAYERAVASVTSTGAATRVVPGSGPASASESASEVKTGIAGRAGPPAPAPIPPTPAGPSKRAKPRELQDYTQIPPPYSPEAIDNDISASIWLRLDIDERGRVTSVHVLRSAGHGLDELAVNLAMTFHFHPALDDDGNPIKSAIGWRIVWDAYWKTQQVKTVYGHPNCRSQGPLNLNEVHPEYIDCDSPPGAFDLASLPGAGAQRK